MSDLMNYNYLLKSEDKTRMDTLKNLKGWVRDKPDFLDVLFETSYFFGTTGNGLTQEKSFHSFAYYKYIRVPYTIQSVSTLIETGYYFETSILLRHILEVLVQIRYFRNHIDLLEKHISNKRIRMKEMFNEFSNNLYDFLYSKQLSEFEHGGIGSIIFMVEFNSNNVEKVKLGCEFDSFYATYILNQLVILVYGFINIIPHIFPSYLELVPREIEEKRLNVLKKLEVYQHEHQNSNEKTKEFYDMILPLLKFT